MLHLPLHTRSWLFAPAGADLNDAGGRRDLLMPVVNGQSLETSSRERSRCCCRSHGPPVSPRRWRQRSSSTSAIFALWRVRNHPPHREHRVAREDPDRGPLSSLGRLAAIDQIRRDRRAAWRRQASIEGYGQRHVRRDHHRSVGQPDVHAGPSQTHAESATMQCRRLLEPSISRDLLAQRSHAILPSE